MKFSKYLIAPLSVCALASTFISAPSFAKVVKCTKPAGVAASAKTAWPQICPMTGTKISSANEAAGKSVYKGKTYYFCCPMCKPDFDKDPAKYVSMAAQHKYAQSM